MTYSEIMDAWKHNEVLSVVPFKSEYEKRKALARCLAVEWQYGWNYEPYDSWEDTICRVFFENVGKRFGLLREFRENGII